MREYRLGMGGQETPLKLLYARRYDMLGWQVREYVESLVFVNPAGKPYEDVLVPVQFPEGIYPRINEIFKAFRQQGLLRPSPEHALRFGIVYPDIQRVNPLVFPHKFWTNSEGKTILVLQGNTEGRRIDLSVTHLPWESRRVFMGVKPR